MSNNLHVSKSRVRSRREAADQKAERDARVAEIMAHVRHHQSEADRLRAEAKRKRKWVKPH